ncbi:CRE-NPP-4 protein [Caenorhabditis remanei]|uniref:CRE-NPP-4 protein n=1 Tax=Caenorhabditis remanei TaxID=31234 RepID=E3N1N1_CAERE|nr:CRE-NPP-4 protein [Caenorhabditis remanei]
MSLFGSNTPAASSTTPLFGTSTASKPAGGSLFGAAPAAATTTSTVPLFGSTTTTSTAGGGLFGSKPAATTTQATGGLFGSTTTTTAPASGGLFGSTSTTTATSASGGLFGSTSTAPATTGGGLFGSTTAAPAATGGGLFGTKPSTTGAATLGGGLFGSTTTSAAPTTTSFGAPPASNTILGLGGIQQQSSSGSTNTTGATTSSLSGTGDKDTTKDSEWQQTQTLIRDMIPLIEEKLKKNRELMEETENMAVDSVSIDEMIDKTRGWINEVKRDVCTATISSHDVAKLVAHDKHLADTARRVQDQSSTANQSMHAELIKKHLGERIQGYDSEIRALQTRVNKMRTRFEKLLKGEPHLTFEELVEEFMKCDTVVSNGTYDVEALGRDIEEVRDLLIEQGYTQLRKWNTTVNHADPVSAISEGAEFFPSQSSLAIIGSALRAPAPAVAPAVGGLGLSTGTSLFGNTGGSSLFGSTATKPAFSGGSLFGSATTTAPTTGTTATTSSLFGAKPATTTPFASTVGNNSCGVLFSSKK